MRRFGWLLLLLPGVLATAAPAASPPAPPAPPGPPASPAPAPLADEQVIALPGVQRRIDHLAVDVAGQRLFVAALGNHTLEVLDLAGGRRITSIAGLDEPQGVAYVASSHRIVVATRAGGAITAFDDRTYQPVATITNEPDADNLRLDAATGELYVGHGDGALGVIDPASMKLVADVPLPAHPESFRLEEAGPRIFVNVPPTREIVVVDRRQRTIVQHVPLGSLGDNYPMSLDEKGHRLFVATRRPARLVVIDTVSARQITAVPCVGDSDDLFYDARRDRVYVIGGEGFVDVIDADPAAHYARLSRIVTRAGARTGLWSSELDRLFVAFPARERRAAEIHVLRAPAGG